MININSNWMREKCQFKQLSLEESEERRHWRPPAPPFQSAHLPSPPSDVQNGFHFYFDVPIGARVGQITSAKWPSSSSSLSSSACDTRSRHDTMEDTTPTGQVSVCKSMQMDGHCAPVRRHWAERSPTFSHFHFHFILFWFFCNNNTAAILLQQQFKRKKTPITIYIYIYIYEYIVIIIITVEIKETKEVWLLFSRVVSVILNIL